MEILIEKIDNEDSLLRRVFYLDPRCIRDDITATPMAFRLRKKIGETGLSVYIERLTTYAKAIRDITQYRLFSLKASHVRDIGVDCIHKPEPDDNAHAEIVGDITNSVSSKLAKAAVYVNYP